MQAKKLIIHFNDVSLCLRQIKELGIKISPETRYHIKQLHNAVIIVNEEMPQKVMAEVCYRTANRILKRIESETEVKFERYKLHNYLLS